MSSDPAASQPDDVTLPCAPIADWQSWTFLVIA